MKEVLEKKQGCIEKLQGNLSNALQNHLTPKKRAFFFWVKENSFQKIPETFSKTGKHPSKSLRKLEISLQKQTSLLAPGLGPGRRSTLPSGEDSVLRWVKGRGSDWCLSCGVSKTVGFDSLNSSG